MIQSDNQQPVLLVDPETPLGPMKPVNGVNNGPFCLDGIYDFSPEFAAAAFADVRTHDPNYPCRNVCDINAVFPREDADPDDPASYDFTRTDHYLKTIRDAGCTVTYRLGYTIDHHPIKRYSHPPKDFHHWARVCLGIARHYNEGWADGFQNWVARWEIWNEPDNAPGPDSRVPVEFSNRRYFMNFLSTAPGQELRWTFIRGTAMKVARWRSCGSPARCKSLSSSSGSNPWKIFLMNGVMDPTKNGTSYFAEGICREDRARLGK